MWLFDGYINRRPLMERDGSGVSALVGLEGFVVRAQLLDEPSGEWWLAVESLEDRAWCEICGVRAIGHGRRRVVVRDLPLADRPVHARHRSSGIPIRAATNPRGCLPRSAR
jgi:hypothetical protein